MEEYYSASQRNVMGRHELDSLGSAHLQMGEYYSASQRNVMGRHELDSLGSAHLQMAECCECANEPLGFIKCGGFLAWLRNYLLFKKYSTVRSLLLHLYMCVCVCVYYKHANQPVSVMMFTDIMLVQSTLNEARNVEDCNLQATYWCVTYSNILSDVFVCRFPCYDHILFWFHSTGFYQHYSGRQWRIRLPCNKSVWLCRISGIVECDR